MELLFQGGKQLNIIAYNDNESLDDAAHTLKQTLEKCYITIWYISNKRNGWKETKSTLDG